MFVSSNGCTVAFHTHLVFLSVLKMIGELKTTLNEKELPKLWISPTWPSMLVSQKDKKFFQEILDAEMKALYLLECDTVSMKDFNTRLEEVRGRAVYFDLYQRAPERDE